MDFNQALSWWSFALLGYLLWEVGEASKRYVRANWNGWVRLLFDRTVTIHAPIGGMLAAIVPGFPLPDGVPSTMAARVLFGLSCGVLCSYSHRAIRVALGRKGGASNA